MKALGKRDAGTQFIAPSGRHVEFVVKRDGTFLFAYLDDPTDGLALSLEGLRLLEPAKASAALEHVQSRAAQMRTAPRRVA